MNFARLLSTLFVSGQIGLVVWLDSWSATLLIAFASVALSLFQPNRWQLRDIPHLLLVVALGIAFGLFGVAAAMQGSDLKSLFRLFAEFLLVIQALELLRRPRGASNSYLPGLSALSITLLVLSLETEQLPATINWVYAGLVTAQFLILRPDLARYLTHNGASREKALTLTLVLLASLTVANLFQAELTGDMQQLRRVLGTSEPTDRGNGYISGSDASFVLKVGLNSIAKIQRLNPDENVFDVEAAGAPGYMRTLSFAAYEGSSWRILTQRFQMNFEGRIVRPGNLPSDFLDLRVPSSHAPFQLREMLGKPRRQMNISVQAGAGSLVPLPLDATVVLGSPRKARTLPLDIHGNIKPGSLDNRSYQVLCGRRSSSKLSGSYRRSLLQLPDADRSFLRRLAADLVAKAEVKSDQEIAESISNYFQREFQYTLEPVQRLGGDGRSAIRVFLEDRHPAHCEYFATASVLLLRSLSIPARLSTGYLVYEYNDEVDLYQATNENAHAWAEYFDESLGQWRMLESTPGIPEYVAKFGSAGVGDRASNLRSELDSGWLNWTSLALNTLVDLFDQGRRLLRILFTSRFAWLLPLGLLVLLFWIRVSNARHIQQSRRYEAPLSELTRKADHLAGQWGYRRAVHETCIQFALRLRETQCSELQPLADWYDAFAAVRYLPSNSDDIDNRQLIPDLPHIRRPDRSRDRLAATN